MYRTVFPGDFLSDIDRLHRQVLRFPGSSGNIRGYGRSGFPPLNVGTTPESIEIFAFAPGLDPASIEVTIDRGVLTLSGVRKNELPADSAKSTIHINERFAGTYRRVVSLSDDIDADSTVAKYTDGVLRIRIGRRTASQSRRINVE